MFLLIRDWLNPAVQSGYQPQRGSTINDTVISVALSVLALMTANMFDREAPGLAMLLRYVPVGVTLIWLFKRCGLDNNDGYRHHQYPITTSREEDRSLNSSSSLHTAPQAGFRGMRVASGDELYMDAAPIHRGDSNDGRNQ